MDSPRLVIDTNIIIDYLRSRQRLVRRIVSIYECSVTVITVYELQAVAQLSSGQASLLHSLFENVGILALDSLSAESSARIYRALSARGQHIGLPDTFIAGICLAHNLPLLTRNAEHFKRVDGLQVVTPDELNALITSE
ncbi:MAG: type II toxin-antitoxin system VapC family toxin [Anaerolineales bacterium]